LRRPLIGFHPDRLQLGRCPVGLMDGLLCGFFAADQAAIIALFRS
jgi:hypothetical protein